MTILELSIKQITLLFLGGTFLVFIVGVFYGTRKKKVAGTIIDIASPQKSNNYTKVTLSTQKGEKQYLVYTNLLDQIEHTALGFYVELEKKRIEAIYYLTFVQGSK